MCEASIEAEASGTVRPEKAKREGGLRTEAGKAGLSPQLPHLSTFATRIEVA